MLQRPLSHTDMRLALISLAVFALSVQQAVSLPSNKRGSSYYGGMYSICIFHPNIFYGIFIIDIIVAQIALTLEYLEVAFYQCGLNQFDEAAFEQADYSPIVRRRFEEILAHEKDHVAALISFLGDNALEACSYDLCVFFGMGF